MLQFMAGLGEQATLNSVPQDTTYLTQVPGTKQVEQSDAIAYSKVTLTTAASTTGKPGVNFDVLSNQSVANRGAASVVAKAGLSESGGDVGTAIQVTIAPERDKGEKVGGPVEVRLGFAFNVRTFASRNASTSFNYSATYIYQEALHSLASNLYNFTGLNPAGPGPVNLETATFNAKIGDSFTLKLSENLSAQTNLATGGVGINNAGWLVDTNLDVSVDAQTLLTANSLTWSDANDSGVDLAYRVDGPAPNADVPVKFYWARGTAYPNDSIKEVLYSDNVPAGTVTQPGDYRTIHIPGFDLKGAPTGATHLLAVMDPGDTLRSFDATRSVVAMELRIKHIPYYNQGYLGDQPWSEDPLLGSADFTVGGSGCKSVALDMALNAAGVTTGVVDGKRVILDPGALNKILTAQADAGAISFPEANMDFGTATPLRNGRCEFDVSAILPAGGNHVGAGHARPAHDQGRADPRPRPQSGQ